MSKKISLSEKLSSLIHTKPVLSDPEDPEDDDLTKANDLTKNDDHSDFSADELDLVKFRKLNIEFLDADDHKYSGKKSSRNEVTKAFGSDSSDVEGSSDEDFNDSRIDDDESAEESSQDEDIHENDDSAEGDSYDDDDEKPASAPADSSFDEKFNQEIISKASGDIEKGTAIKNQLHIWDFLLECRMKFQKCLITSNQLPSSNNFKKFQQHGGPELENLLSQNQKSLNHLLDSLMDFQEILLERNDEYKQSAKHKLSTDDEEEEITSESDVEKENDEKTMDDERKVKNKRKKRKLSDFSSEIDERHKQLEKFRNKTIQKWNDKTRLGHISNKDFHGFEQSTLKQIEHVLQDKQRLIKRTQVKRSNYHILGQNDEEDSPPNKILKTDNDIPVDVPNVKETERKICTEIFDDDDFYIQLLNELVKRKGSDITDPLQLGKQWVQLQKHRNKIKKDIDRRASKGRKIRYVVHPKLVNFMMPIPKMLCSEESRIELINSLFGKNKK